MDLQKNGGHCRLLHLLLNPISNIFGIPRNTSTTQANRSRELPSLDVKVDGCPRQSNTIHNFWQAD